MSPHDAVVSSNFFRIFFYHFLIEVIGVSQDLLSALFFFSFLYITL